MCSQQFTILAYTESQTEGTTYSVKVWKGSDGFHQIRNIQSGVWCFQKLLRCPQTLILPPNGLDSEKPQNYIFVLNIAFLKIKIKYFCYLERWEGFSQSMFPSILGSQERMQLLLLEIFIQSWLTRFDTVPAGAGSL